MVRSGGLAIPKIAMNREGQDIRRLANALRANLAKCAHDPDVDGVHDTRTGTRRLQATLENLVRETGDGASGAAVCDAAKALMRQLKRIRRAAGAVRDLDVHRKLLEKLAERALGSGNGKAVDGETAKSEPMAPHAVPDILETPEARLRTGGIAKYADDLDAWLKHHRNAQAERLLVLAPDLLAKFDKRLAETEDALREHPRRRRAKAPAMLALDNFAQLATEMQLLDATNLHDFRKGTKKARYVAELAAQSDAQAGAVGKTLKKLQDEIGDWHDWLVLADEAHAALGTDAAELTVLVEAEREQHFVTAMKTAAKLRGRLMGEWLATGQKRRPRTTKKVPDASQSAPAQPATEPPANRQPALAHAQK
jgi:CHAD domain-containing protein